MESTSSSTETPFRRRILIVDKHALLRRGLRTLIDNEPDLIVCAEAATYREALEAIASSTPDLVIAGLSLEDGYVLKQKISETLLLAIRCVLGGEQYVSPQIGISFQRGPLPLGSAPVPRLHTRQRAGRHRRRPCRLWGNPPYAKQGAPRCATSKGRGTV